MSPASGLIVATLAILWTGFGVLATIVAVRRIGVAQSATDRAERLDALLATAPVFPFTAFTGGRIAVGERTARWLGCPTAPETVEGLAAAQFAASDIVALSQAIAASLSSARPLDLTIICGGRHLHFTGSPVTLPHERERSLLVWIRDTSDAATRIAQLSAEQGRLDIALEGLSGLIEAAPFAVWHRDPSGRLALVNQAYVRAVEASDADEVVRRGLELIEPGPASVVRSNGVDYRRAAAIIGGERHMMRVVEQPIRGFGSAGFAIDVQEFEDAVSGLSRLVEAQRAMTDRLSAGVVQFGADHTLTFCNLHFRRLFALDADILDDHPEFDRVLERMREAERAPETRDFRAWRADRRAWFNSAEAVEESWLLPTGTHLRVVAQPLPDGGLLVIFEDRTEQLQLASARDTLLQVRSATFDNLFEAIAVFAGDGRLHLWNNRFRDTWGLDDTVLVGHPHLDALIKVVTPRLADQRDAGLIRELIRVATVDRHPRGGRTSLTDGRHFEYAAVPLPDGNALFTLIDITAGHDIEQTLRTRNEDLVEANQQRSRFVARMSYELRVPLTSISGFAEMLSGGYAGELSTTARDYVEAILRASERLQALVSDALDLSQSESGSLALASDPIEVSRFVRETAQIAADAATAADIRLVVDSPADCGRINGDTRRLRRCLDHLLRNAMAHTPPGGRVLLRSRLMGDWVEVVVSDTGVGIPEEEQALLLGKVNASGMPGQEAPRRHFRQGVGLPLARQLIAAHGGTLRLNSEPGRGTDVVIHLPVAPDA